MFLKEYFPQLLRLEDIALGDFVDEGPEPVVVLGKVGLGVLSFILSDGVGF